jgi:hypothetical protein
MSDAAEAHLAYGYNLGSPGNGGWKLAGADEYGDYEFPWSDGGYQIAEHAAEMLVNATGFVDIEGESRSARCSRRREIELALPVRVERSGHHDVPGYVLLVDGTHKSVEWTDAMTLDPAELGASRPEWDAQLAAALKALGITPTQDGPKWLVFPSYG